MNKCNKSIQDHLANTFSSERDMCKEYNIAYNAFYQRYHVKNWNLEDALTIPVREKNHKTNKANKIIKDQTKKEESFTVTNNYPQKEYLRYLKNNKVNLEELYPDITNDYVRLAISEKIGKIKEEINEISNHIYFYTVMDMIYAGEVSSAKQMCSHATFQNCILFLTNPSGRIKEIYVDFANQFNMRNQLLFNH